ncbi:NADPH-dependent FMN reductase [Rhizobium sp. SG2393]|uniref:NADPH-dependent FMN reductase n=1 Tax=Rhizobium sp. SG2393 TaxID=3276279 RepID=UPI003671491B
MTRLVGLSGSLRRNSFNRSLLKEAVRLAPDGVEIEPHGIEGVPLYNADVEKEEGVPEAVARLRSAITSADGLILFTPEYNNSLPGVFKNAIDWITSSGSDGGKVLSGKPVALAGTTPGGFGTILSQNAWLPVLHTLGADIFSGKRLMLAHAGKLFDADGHIADGENRDKVVQFLKAFGEYVSARV